ncbi:cell wall hydrolase [Bacillus thuringiensis]|uniref:S-layer homology domain-containing protein n=1 Tax=Bacillus thuringiensis TaxID=1428 RepID=UPI000BFA13B1|nr:S-layer homology domain-containing protein [Bacillus thuringiensis]PFV87182.1 cell wall hydrolase [Bacillus thuringiensis]PGR88961.1 cell wall hydrolase [Bacillus thuringiensis]
MKNKLIVAGIVTGTLLSYSSNSFADTLRFQDVPKWAEQSVNYLVDKHAIHGLPNGTFGSYETLDRASAAKIITTALGMKITPNEKSSFTDVQNHWGASYIAAAEKAGIVKGAGNGLFNPSEKVTRAAIATMLVNAYKLQSPVKSDGKTKFKDLQGHWGEKYASILVDLGISNGTDNGWQPDRFVTRAEAAQLIAKTDMLQNKSGGALNHSKETISPIKEGHMDGVVNSIIRDSKGDYIEINYKDKNGKEHSVYVLVSKKHDFEDGDKVKVGQDGKIVYHKRFGYQTTQYNNVNSKIFSDPKVPVAKVNDESNNQQENHVVGVINDAETYYVTVTYKDANGNSQEVDVDFPNDENAQFKFQKGDKVKVDNKDKWEKHPVSGHIATADSITKVNDESNNQQENHVVNDNREEKILAQLEKRSGKVIKKSKDSVEISSENKTIRAHVNPKVITNINIGDTVNVYAKAFEIDPILLKDLPFEARNAIIQKGNEQNILEKQYEKITGDIVGKSENSILVSSNNITYVAEVSPKLLQDIILGDTVNVYAASFERSPILLPNVPVDAISPIIEKR